ncbi:glycoside hydrolase family 30 protein [Dyella sp. A6]|uniref:glycoside hydrolase family 30 protein n=1 Tax=Dyella aluminiiresistens TaxID=3069105 RepID=UPI002E792F51|nr:glycoside hydrolase family 30 beta sandwich domain-containing protein [Dyella sp. A6]
MHEGGTSPRWMAIALVILLSMGALSALRIPLRLPPAPPLRQLPLTALPGSAIEVWVSTQDRRLQLARQPDIPVAVQAAASADIVIDTRRSYQSIVGFGGALTDSSAWLMQHRMTAAQRAALLRNLFGPPPGLGLNMLRLTIGASDFSRKPYTLDDMPAGQVDPELQHFNIAADLRNVVPTLRELLDDDPELRIVASPWSAPAWMKTSANLIGGTLLPQYESVYAQYLVKYVDAFRGLGIPIWGLTLQNEPAFEPVTYPGMLLPADMRARIIGQYLGPALAAREPQTHILAWDHNWDAPAQPLSVLADPGAARYIRAVAWHCYAGDPTAQTQVHSAYPGKGVYVTECSGGDWASAEGGELLWFAQDLLLGSLRNWARGVIYWNLVLDEQHGPHDGGCGNCRGLVTVDSKTGEISRNDEYYAFAHYSRFVRPGAVRVWSTATGPGLDNVAFRNADGGSVVLVVTNSTNRPHRVRVQQGKVFFAYTMLPMSVATFEWNPALAAEGWETRLKHYAGALLQMFMPHDGKAGSDLH